MIWARTTKLPTRLSSIARAIFERSLSWSRIVGDNGYGEKNAAVSELGARHVAELLALRIRRPMADKGLRPRRHAPGRLAQTRSKKGTVPFPYRSSR